MELPEAEARFIVWCRNMACTSLASTLDTIVEMEELLERNDGVFSKVARKVLVAIVGRWFMDAEGATMAPPSQAQADEPTSQAGLEERGAAVTTRGAEAIGSVRRRLMQSISPAAQTAGVTDSVVLAGMAAVRETMAGTSIPQALMDLYPEIEGRNE